MTIQVHVHAIKLPATKRAPIYGGYEYVIFKDNQVVGAAIVEKIDADRYIIDSIKVNEPLRGGKFGSALLQRVVDDADRDDVQLELYAIDPDPGMFARKVAWYERFGFVGQRDTSHGTHGTRPMSGTWMLRPAAKHRVGAPPLHRIQLTAKEAENIARTRKKTREGMKEAEIKRVAKRVKHEFNFTGSQNTMEPLDDIGFYHQSSEPFADLEPWQQRYILSQAMDPNVESSRNSEEAHQEVAEYTYAFATIPLDKFPVSYWERHAGQLVIRVDDEMFDDETRYLAIQIQRVFDLQLKIEKEGFDRKQPIVVLGIASNGNPRFAVDNGHHRLQALRNLVKAGKIRSTMRVPVVIRYRKDIHGYGQSLYRGITDVHHLLKTILGDKHWPETVVTIPFTFGRGANGKTLITYMKRLDANRISIETAMPLAREPKISMLRDAIAYIRRQRPGIQVVSKSRYPGDKAVLKQLEREGVIDCVLGETCEEAH